MNRALPTLATILLIILIGSAYCGTFNSPPILDDYHTFIDQRNVYIKEWSLPSFVRLSETVFGWARWLPMVSFAVDHWVGKGDVFYFHLTNTLIHCLCLLTVIFLVYNLLEADPKKEISVDGLSSSMFAVFVAGLWALNPVQTNAVTYLVQRMASLQAFFFTGSVACYLWGRRVHLRNRSFRHALLCYTGCVCAAAGALLCKENSAILPVMILVTEVWFFSPGLPTSIWMVLRRSRKAVWGLLLILILACALLSFEVVRWLAAGYTTRHFGMLERLLTETRIIVWYMTLLLWPSPSRMAIEHDIVVSTSLINPPSTLFSIIFLMVLGWVALRYRRKFPLMSYGVTWFGLNLLIESSIVPLELIFEHRLYLPSVGLILTFACALVGALRFLLTKQTLRDFRIITCSVLALLISVLTLLTFSRNEAWRDIITIYQDAVLKAPNNPRAHANLAVAYGMAGHYEQSMNEAELAIAVGREHHENWVVAANAILGSLNGLGRCAEAVERGEQLLQSRPSRFKGDFLPSLYLNLAEANLSCGQLEGAYAATLKSLEWTQQKRRGPADLRLIERMFLMILKESAKMQVDLNQDNAFDPGESSIKVWIARELLARGEREEARRLFTLASRENPDDAEAVRFLEGINREDALNHAQAVKENTKQQYSSLPFSRFNAFMALAYRARTPDMPVFLRNAGEKLLNYALEIHPGAADAHLLKAYYLHDRKEIEPAIAATERALALDPNYAKAWLALGFFQMELNQFQTAVTAFRKGLELYPGCPQRQSVLAAITAIEQNPALSTAQN